MFVSPEHQERLIEFEALDTITFGAEMFESVY